LVAQNHKIQFLLTKVR